MKGCSVIYVGNRDDVDDTAGLAIVDTGQGDVVVVVALQAGVSAWLLDANLLL